MKSYPRNSGVKRSGSILNTIKNIVAAPLSWFGGNDSAEPGKRRRDEEEREPTEEAQEEDRRKKMRIEIPLSDASNRQSSTLGAVYLVSKEGAGK